MASLRVQTAMIRFRPPYWIERSLQSSCTRREKPYESAHSRADWQPPRISSATRGYPAKDITVYEADDPPGRQPAVISRVA